MKHIGLVTLAILLGAAPAHAQTNDERKATVGYLRGLQADDGGFLPAQAKPPSSLRATSSALRALKYMGGEPADRPAAIHFVESCFDRETGGFADRPGLKPDVASTAVGAMAVAELRLPLERYADPVSRYLGEHAKTFEEIRIAAAGLEALGKRPAQADAWLEQVAQMRNPKGTYGEGAGLARDTGSAVVIVLRLGGKVENQDGVLKALRAGQRADGGFGKADTDGSDLESSYRIVRALVMLKQKPADVPELRSFVARCRSGTGYGVAPGQPASASGTYFASTLLHWLAED